MSLSQQDVAIATSVLEAGVLALPIVAILLQYASQSRFAERPEFQGKFSYHSLILGLTLTMAIPLVISILAAIFFLSGNEFPLFKYSYLDISLSAMGVAAGATALLIWNLRKISDRSDSVRAVHEEISFQLLGIDEIAEQVKDSDEVPISVSEGDTDEAFRDYLMWVWREDPEVFEELKKGLQDTNQAELDDFS